MNNWLKNLCHQPNLAIEAYGIITLGFSGAKQRPRKVNAERDKTDLRPVGTPTLS